MPQASTKRPNDTQRNPYNRSQVKRMCVEAERVARRRAIEQQYAKSTERPKGFVAGSLEPVAPVVFAGSYNPPGFYRRGALQGVVYGNKNRSPFFERAFQ